MIGGRRTDEASATIVPSCLDRMAAPILPQREEPDINTLCPQSTFQELPVMGKEYASFRSLGRVTGRVRPI